MAVRIYVDQRHNLGNIDAGASGNGVVEPGVTYWMGIYFAGFLYADQHFEIGVSRPFPDAVLGYDQVGSLRARVDEANAWPADYFISIHVNSNPDPVIDGSEVYVHRENSIAYDLGANVLESIVDLVETRYNQVRIGPSSYVLQHISVPAIPVGLAYLSNLRDAEKLLNDQYLFAFFIHIGILNYLGYSYDPLPRH